MNMDLIIRTALRTRDCIPAAHGFISSASIEAGLHCDDARFGNMWPFGLSLGFSLFFY